MVTFAIFYLVAGLFMFFLLDGLIFEDLIKDSIISWFLVLIVVTLFWPLFVFLTTTIVITSFIVEYGIYIKKEYLHGKKTREK